MNLPVKGYGTIAFDKSQFDWSDFLDFNKLLNNGVLTAKLFYEVSDGVYIGATYKRFYELDLFGVIQEKNSFSFETQMGL